MWFRRMPHELVAFRRSARCGMMIGCAAATFLPGCDERVRVTAASSGERPGQGGGDLGARPPDHGPGAAAGQGPATVLPGRPGVPGRPAAPAPTRRAWPVPAAGAVRAENLCHQAILMNHASGAVSPPEAEVVQVSDAIGQRTE